MSKVVSCPRCGKQYQRAGCLKSHLSKCRVGVEKQYEKTLAEDHVKTVLAVSKFTDSRKPETCDICRCEQKLYTLKVCGHK
jgi:hypothetical protein